MTQNPDPALSHPITEDDIAHYLSITPDFFLRHAELLAAVQLTSPHSNRAVSLQERQAEMLREKIKLLEQRIMEMIRHGNDNVILSDKILRLGALLLRSGPSAELPRAIEQQMAQLFSVPQVALRLWGVQGAHAQMPFAQGVSDDVQQFVASLTEPFCGLNTGFEATQWLEQPQAALSLALVPLHRLNADGAATGPAFGLLVLASGDAQRFTNGMGTDFLVRIAGLLSAALSRLLAD